MARPDQDFTGGVVRSLGGNKHTLAFAAVDSSGKDLGYYELDGELELRRVDDPMLHEQMKKHTAIPAGVLSVDAASVLYIDDSGKRWRLPKGDPYLMTAYDRKSLVLEADKASTITAEIDLTGDGGWTAYQ